MKNESKKKFAKRDKEKLVYEAIAVRPLEDLAKVLTFGVHTYGLDNWRECDDPRRYRDALWRHWQEHRKGNLMDPETGVPHLTAVMVNAMFLLELEVYPNLEKSDD